jgi:hypothetical protein
MHLKKLDTTTGKILLSSWKISRRKTFTDFILTGTPVIVHFFFLKYAKNFFFPRRCHPHFPKFKHDWKKGQPDALGAKLVQVAEEMDLLKSFQE